MEEFASNATNVELFSVRTSPASISTPRPPVPADPVASRADRRRFNPEMIGLPLAQTGSIGY